MLLVSKKSFLVFIMGFSICIAQSYQNESAHGLGDYNIPFFKADAYRPNVQPPGEFLGFTLGARPVHHYEVLDYFNYLDKLLDNINLTEYGYTYEGKPLVYLMISSKKNMANINTYHGANQAVNSFAAGYGNTTSAINAFIFRKSLLY